MSVSVYRSIINDYHDELKKQVQTDTERELKTFSNIFYSAKQSQNELANPNKNHKHNINSAEGAKTHTTLKLVGRLEALLHEVKEARAANLINLSSMEDIEKVKKFLLIFFISIKKSINILKYMIKKINDFYS